MQVSLFTDEVHQDPEVFIPFFSKEKIRFAEIRTVRGKRVPFLEPGDKKRLPSRLRDQGIKTSAVSPGLFKAKAKEGRAVFEKGLQYAFLKALEAAHDFGCTRVIIFVPDKPKGAKSGDFPAWLIEGLYKAASMAAKENLRVCLENEPGTWAGTGDETRRLLSRVWHPHLRANWDPANAFFAGETPWPDGYRKLRPLVDHVHVKDAVGSDKGNGGIMKFVPLGKGMVAWEKQLQDLVAEDYNGFITLETHCEPLEKTTPLSLKALRRLLDEIGIPI